MIVPKLHDSPLRRFDATGLPLLIARLVLAYIFITFGVAKLADPFMFLKMLRLYHLYPESPPYFMNLTVIVLPWLEIVTGTALLIGLRVRGAALIQLLMLVPFTIAVLRRAFEMMRLDPNLPFSLVKFDCGCGSGEEIIWRKTLLNSALIILAAYALFSRTRRFCLERFFDSRQFDSHYCHLCGYSSPRLANGVCDRCISAPLIPAQS
ncbi:MAG: DoxX family protein [Planctomycetes bacterium]|nr:DoxX family protein [Planctomycetota bacterium]MBI3833250.1 DoxX family protein [Planctomycetota bacterium]